MTDMFSKYDNLSAQYKPSNLNKPFDKPKPLVSNIIYKPFEEYDKFGNLIGYYWYYGDTRNLEFEISGELVVDGNSEFADITDFIQDKEVVVTISNFRREPVITQIFEGNANIIFPIDQALSLKMVPGVYYCTLTVRNKNYAQSFQFGEDFVLTVK